MADDTPPTYVEHVHCHHCGKRVSGVDPEMGLVVRAHVECPECLEAKVPDPLKWHAEGFRRWSAWSTVGGTFTPHHYHVAMFELAGACTLDIHDLRRTAQLTAIFRGRFDHREWTEDMIKAFAETIRPTLPTFQGRQELTADEIVTIDQRLRALRGGPTRCYFHHVFPPGADDRRSVSASGSRWGSIGRNEKRRNDETCLCAVPALLPLQEERLSLHRGDGQAWRDAAAGGPAGARAVDALTSSG